MRNRPYVADWSFVVLQPLALVQGTQRILWRRVVPAVGGCAGRRSSKTARPRVVHAGAAGESRARP